MYHIHVLLNPVWCHDQQHPNTNYCNMFTPAVPIPQQFYKCVHQININVWEHRKTTCVQYLLTPHKTYVLIFSILGTTWHAIRVWNHFAQIGERGRVCPYARRGALRRESPSKEFINLLFMLETSSLAQLQVAHICAFLDSRDHVAHASHVSNRLARRGRVWPHSRRGALAGRSAHISERAHTRRATHAAAISLTDGPPRDQDAHGARSDTELGEGQVRHRAPRSEGDNRVAVRLVVCWFLSLCVWLCYWFYEFVFDIKLSFIFSAMRKTHTDMKEVVPKSDPEKTSSSPCTAIRGRWLCRCAFGSVFVLFCLDCVRESLWTGSCTTLLFPAHSDWNYILVSPHTFT